MKSLDSLELESNSMENDEKIFLKKLKSLVDDDDDGRSVVDHRSLPWSKYHDRSSRPHLMVL